MRNCRRFLGKDVFSVNLQIIIDKDGEAEDAAIFADAASLKQLRKSFVNVQKSCSRTRKLFPIERGGEVIVQFFPRQSELYNQVVISSSEFSLEPFRSEQ